ncbi:subtilisin-like protease Glyma18g48580 [Prosopis cineraria]|uniref:subtilisin-like protease Glyma18g48580 n=1 Tax=Prosopis cineraria TaxID=364024 RepID=UPI00240F3228|nr:subtilisin-like protease Glyma18g48580 [Prosopis cineraria]
MDTALFHGSGVGEQNVNFTVCLGHLTLQQQRHGKGGSLKARPIYKACWTRDNSEDFTDVDLLSAFDQAIDDGVDLLSVSIGRITVRNATHVFTNGISIGSFLAVSRGILVTSGGNDGPELETVTKLAPWIFTVALAPYTALNRCHYITYDSGCSCCSQLCKSGTLDSNKVKGRILVCQRGRSLRPVDKGQEAKRVGALKMILQNHKKFNTATADAQVLDTSNVPNSDPQNESENSSDENLLAFLDNAKSIMPVKPAPKVSLFSSREPSLVLPSTLKPDVAAPGQNIIAAYSSGRRFDYNILSGTSMACPHVTSTTWDDTNGPNLDENDDQVATPLHYGSGYVKPNRAIYPGLVYDLDAPDYLNLLCASDFEERIVVSLNYNRPYKCPKLYRLQDFNYPSITLPFLGVEPECFSYSFKRWSSKHRTNENESYEIIPQAEEYSAHKLEADYSFGKVTWTDGMHKVRSPIVLKFMRK